MDFVAVRGRELGYQDPAVSGGGGGRVGRVITGGIAKRNLQPLANGLVTGLGGFWADPAEEPVADCGMDGIESAFAGATGSLSASVYCHA